MNLLLGHTINTTDGPFGTITDIVVDAENWTVAHLIVQPLEDEFVSKLVPFWLLGSDGQRPVIGLTKSTAMRLEMVSLAGLVSIAAERLVEPPSADPVSDSTVVGRPVRSIDGEFVGRVAGLSVTHRHLDAVIVRTGDSVFGQLAVVPMIDVDAIRPQRIDLYVSQAQVKPLCASSRVAGYRPRQPSFERDPITAARQLDRSHRPRPWPRWQKRHQL